MATHHAVVEWARPAETSDADFLAGHYSRLHTIGFDGGVTLPGSASPSVVRAPWSVEAAADPEELLVAAVSNCHMLWFLDLAKHAGFPVLHYRDEPSGRMGKTDEGRIAVTQVVLRPVVTFSGVAPDPQALSDLHEKAHAACFIANSLRSDVIIEAVDPLTQGGG